MKQALVRTIRERQLWEPGERVAIAVSGGADSTALAHLLRQTRGLHGGVLSIVHVDHGWSDASEAWAAQVQALAVTLDLPFQLERVACERSEASARAARYAVFEGLEVDRVALAHHRRDQVETVLINLLRGGRGLRGMRARRGRYVRPLLDADPDALRSWCDRHGLAFVEDPSNTDPAFLRTRVRALLPALEEAREGAGAAIARAAAHHAEDDALLEALASELPLERVALASAPPPLARRRLRQWLEPVTAGPLDALLAAIQRGSGVVQVDGERRVRVSADRIVLGG